MTTLTKKSAEDLTHYLHELGIRVEYLHSGIDAIERVEILHRLRAGEFDVLVGINLLREGLDLPEVSLVAILDADKEGFLRSVTSLVQTAGRAARHVGGRVILYAEHETLAMRELIRITESHRAKQIAYNKAHGIVPRSVKRAQTETTYLFKAANQKASAESPATSTAADTSTSELIAEMTREMLEAADNLEFERAAYLRDQITAYLRDQIKTLKKKSTANEASHPTKGTRKKRPSSASVDILGGNRAGGAKRRAR